MSEVVNYVTDRNIGVISVDYPPVNALSQAVRQGLYDAITAGQTGGRETLGIVLSLLHNLSRPPKG